MSGGGGPAHLTANVRVFMGNREITDIVRVEAEAVTVATVEAITSGDRYNP